MNSRKMKSKQRGYFIQRVLDKTSTTRLFALSPGIVIVLAAVIPIPASATSYRLPTQCSAAAVCSPVGAGLGPIVQFATSGKARYNIEGNIGFVRQQDNKAIVNWKDFNIGPDNTVRYVRVDENGNPVDGASFSTLNRIYQNSKSLIEGKIDVQAGQNGAIYLINQNGILFKGNAQVDVNTLIASSLNIKDDDFLSTSGIFNAGTNPIFNWEGNDAAAFREAYIEVGQDAKLNAQLGHIITGSGRCG